jgi:hypothetical protein
MTFVCYNEKGIPVSVIAAKSDELAQAYWQGKGLTVWSSACLETDFTPLDDTLTGVIPLVTTKERNLGDVFKPKMIVEVASRG